MEHRVNLRCTREEAVELRTALHIATRLCALLPHGYGNKNWSDAFGKLHDTLRDNAVDILPGALAFSGSIIAVIREHGEHPDDRLIRELTQAFGGVTGRPLDVFATRPSSGKSMIADMLMLEHLLTLPPPVIVDMDFVQLEQRVLSCLNPEPRKLPDVLMDDQSARHVALTASQTGLVNAKKATGWVVQYNLNECTARTPDWKLVEHLGLPQSSRNAAYRMLRARAKSYGKREDAYRVVPAGTPDGPEKDRGFYTAEFFTKHAVRQSQLGWNTSSVIGLNGTFTTAQAARNAIAAHVGNDPNRIRRYRVKWHPSHA